MDRIFVRIAGAAAVLLFAAVVVHSFRRPPRELPRGLRLEAAPPSAPPAPPPEPPRTAAPGRAERSPERLLPFLERLGRARLVRDARTLAGLRRKMEPVFEEDFEWIRGRLSGDLLAAAGAAELAAAFGRRDAVGDLAAVLARAASPLLKDVAIDVLALLGGDGAAAALVTAARSDGDEGIRARAAAALGAFSGPEAYVTLTAALRDPSGVVRSAAATALLRLPSREAVDALIWALA
ncbi:MAG: HEAT repeat domain-containing protein, partial [Planctomycetes bacterium]|nr:HEAT repeat domain-containing protein [Planctomycetota bacterium]